MKILERIVNGLIRHVVSIDDSQFGLVPGRGTTDAIFVVRQLQEKYLTVNKRLIYGLCGPKERAVELVPMKVIWWALRKLDVYEWIVRLVQGIYTGSCWWELQPWVWGDVQGPPGICTRSLALHHCAGGLVMWVPRWRFLEGPICRWSCHHCRLPVGMCQEALDLERCHGEEWVERQRSWFVICGTGLDLLQSSGEYPSAVCRTGVGNNSIYCTLYHWATRLLL